MKKNLIILGVGLLIPMSSFCADFEKRVLLEEFTSESCHGCPFTARNVESLLHDSDKYKGKVAVVAHHSGFGRDVFTQPCDEEFTWFYNSPSTYAPGLMFDRNVDYTDNLTSPVMWGDKEVIASKLDAALAAEAQVSMDLETKYDSKKNKVTVTVSCQQADGFDAEDPRITIYITENNVEISETGQAGVDLNDTEYRHQHIIRAYTSVWGERTEWENGEYTYKRTFSLNRAWKTDDITVVAVISNYNSEDPTDCKVYNCAYSDVYGNSGSVGVGMLEDEQEAAYVKGVFDLSGRRYDDESKLSPGFYIKDGKKIIIR